MPLFTTSEVLLGGITVVWALFKKPLQKTVERGWDYASSKLKRGKKSIWLPKKTNEQITNLCYHVLGQYDFSRVTVIQYDGYRRVPVTLEEYEALELCVTHEAVDGGYASVKDEYQNLSCKPYAERLKLLQESREGWIQIPDDRYDEELNDRLMKPARMANVFKSYNFKLNGHVTNGVLACSYMNEYYQPELSPEAIKDLMNVAALIDSLKRKIN